MVDLKTVKEPIEEMTEGFAKLHESREGADMIISCGNARWEVHSALLCSRSDFFHKAIYSGFKEAKSRTVNLDGEDKQAIQRMIQYFYKNDYEDGPLVPDFKISTGTPYLNTTAEPDSDATEPAPQDSKLICNAKMYVLADQLCIWGLKKIALEKFRSAFKILETSEDAADFQKCSEDLLEAVPFVYSSTTDKDCALRIGLIRLIVRYFNPRQLHEDRCVWYFMRKRKNLRAVVCAVPGFAVDLLRSPRLFLADLEDEGHASRYYDDSASEVDDFDIYDED